MKTLIIDQMESFSCGRERGTKQAICEIGMAVAGGFIVGAFSAATAGIGGIFVGVIGSAEWSEFQSYICSYAE